MVIFFHNSEVFDASRDGLELISKRTISAQKTEEASASNLDEILRQQEQATTNNSQEDISKLEEILKGNAIKYAM